MQEADDDDRATAVLFRMSRKAKAELHHDAAALGISVQALLERRALGHVDAVTRHRFRRPGQDHHQDGLPLTG